MKKFYLLTILFFGLTFGAQAQDFGFGIKGGLNFASFSGSDAEELDFEGRTGYHLGLTMEVPVGGDFAIQPEILYSTLGAKTSNLQLDEATDADFNVDYISVPVMLKYYVVGGLNLEAGPQFSWNNKSEIEGDFTQEEVEQEFDGDAKTFDVGGAVGLAYDLPLGLFVGARYIFGLSEIYKNQDVSSNLVQVSVGLKL